MADYDKLHCNFCGSAASAVKKLIAGPDVFICNECVDKCYGILNEHSIAKKIVNKDDKLISPREIKAFLDQYVIAQDYAKEVISVAVHNHYKRIDNLIIDGVEIDKGNCLLMGSSGVGKTLILQTVSRLLSVPFATADATSLTEAGYVGDDVESIIGRLLSAANNDVKAAERGIIFIDECDKKRANAGTSRDVSGEGVQQALLKLLEGTEVMVAPSGVKKTPATELIKVNTRNILFILGGAFVGLEKLVEKSLNKGSGIGFSATTKSKTKYETAELLAKVQPEHLIQYGMIPELVGRLPIVAALSDLDEAQLVRILIEPKNALVKQITAMFGLEGVQLEFDQEALVAIAKIAKQRKTNGRALRSVMEACMMKTQFNLPDLRAQGVVKIIVHENAITDDTVEPEMIFEAKEAEVVVADAAEKEI